MLSLHKKNMAHINIDIVEPPPIKTREKNSNEIYLYSIYGQLFLPQGILELLIGENYKTTFINTTKELHSIPEYNSKLYNSFTSLGIHYPTTSPITKDAWNIGSYLKTFVKKSNEEILEILNFFLLEKLKELNTGINEKQLIEIPNLIKFNEININQIQNPAKEQILDDLF